MFRICWERGHSENPKNFSREDEIDDLFAKELNSQILAEGGEGKYVSFIMPAFDQYADKNLALMEKIYYANGKGSADGVARCDCLFSIHCNWSGNAIPHGFNIYYNQLKTAIDKPLAEKSKMLGACIAHSLINSGYSFWGKEAVAEDHLVAVGNLAVCSYTKMPAVLIELGFLSNKKDAVDLEDPEYRKNYCKAIIEGIKCFSLI